MLHGRLLRNSELVVVSGAAYGAAVNRGSGTATAPCGVSIVGCKTERSSCNRPAATSDVDADMRREMEEASRSEVPILTASKRHGETDRSLQLYRMLVLSCARGAMEVMENVPDGEGYQAPGGGFIMRTILPGRCAGMLFDIMDHVFRAPLKCWSCGLYRALSNEEVSENLKVAVELRKHLLRSAATLDSFPSIKDEVTNYSLAEAARRRTAPVNVDQVNLVRGKGKKSKGKAPDSDERWKCILHSS